MANGPSSSTTLGTETATTLTQTANSYYWMHVQIFGANPTTLRIRAWVDGGTEPTTWTYAVTDSDTNLQAAGSVGLRTYLSSAATNAPVTFTFDNLLVTDAGGNWTLNTSAPQLAQAYHPLSYVVGQDTPNHTSMNAPAATTTISTTKYYYFGTQRIAVRNGSMLSFILGDHLGSTSVTTDQSGNVVSRASYYPFGKVRSSTGTSPTDYGFTGQKLDDDELMFYGARHYDAEIGLFVQADTIVPSAGNPQSLNRYAYVLNSPLKYVDPTGHAEQAPCQSWDWWCWNNRYYEAQGKCYSQKTQDWTRACAPTIRDAEMLAQATAEFPAVLDRWDLQLDRTQIATHLSSFGNAMSFYVQRGVMTSLQALAAIAYVGARLSGNDPDLFMYAMSEVLMGFSGETVQELLANRGAGESNFMVRGFTSTGLHPDYQDPDPNNNQLRHFWFSVALGYLDFGVGMTEASLHESGLPGVGGGGASEQDWHLSVMGVRLGSAIKAHSVAVNQVSGWVILNLTVRFPGCTGIPVPLHPYPICTQ